MPAWPRPGRSRKVRFADKNEAAGAADAAACAPSSLSGGIGVGHKEVLVTRLRKIMLEDLPRRNHSIIPKSSEERASVLDYPPIWLKSCEYLSTKKLRTG
jgi:hypothetical protein